MKKQINIDGVDYTVDIERAIELGLCEAVHKTITDVKVGDVFEFISDCRSETRAVILPYGYTSSVYRGGDYSKFVLGGCRGLEPWSDSPVDGTQGVFTKEQLLDKLNGNGLSQSKWKYIKNINEDVRILIRDAKSE